MWDAWDARDAKIPLLHTHTCAFQPLAARLLHICYSKGTKPRLPVETVSAAGFLLGNPPRTFPVLSCSFLGIACDGRPSFPLMQQRTLQHSKARQLATHLLQPLLQPLLQGPLSLIPSFFFVYKEKGNSVPSVPPGNITDGNRGGTLGYFTASR